ncbi:MAG: hypothetical protein DYG94_08240 [Leptolyngbya sp. PLA3]|nr:MAG: hypothetical protein EDM82_09320 [Cyanobacteria bacterium CYA]MCE7968721.1 hypothetical protein [Leptolyngbya sp. PL-A3]
MKKPDWRRAGQGVGFLLGLALMGWCIGIALSPDNREQLGHLLEATPGQVAILLGCSLGTLLLNGWIFWVVLLPVKRTGLWYMSAVNAVATLISYAPFKISMAFRVLVHNRVDRVPVLTIGAWMAAIAVLALTVLVPALLASMWTGEQGLAWWGLWLGGSTLFTGTAVLMARAFAGERGWNRLAGLCSAMLLGRHMIAGEHGRRLHAGIDMIAHWRASAAAALLRVGDVFVQAVRVWIASQILHIDLGWGPCMVIASTYFLIGALSPIGMLGSREGGSTAVATLAGITTADSAAGILTVSLLITASEALVNLAGGGVGAMVLRVDRWLLNRVSHCSTSPNRQGGLLEQDKSTGPLL